MSTFITHNLCPYITPDWRLQHQTNVITLCRHHRHPLPFWSVLFMNSSLLSVVCDEVGRVSLLLFVGDHFTEQKFCRFPIYCLVCAHNWVKELIHLTRRTEFFAMRDTRGALPVTLRCLGDVAVPCSDFHKEHVVWISRPLVFVFVWKQ